MHTEGCNNNFTLTCENRPVIEDRYVWDTTIKKDTVIASVPGAVWSGWLPGVTAGADVLIGKIAGNGAVSLQAAYTKYYGRLHPGAWEIGPRFRF